MLFAILLASAIVPGGAFHDSLNFIVGPNAKQCFYEEFADASTVKTIDVFVQSGGLHAIGMQISGPLSVEEVRKGVYSPVVVEKSIDAVRMGQAETDSFLYDFEAPKPGTYAICLDNSRAHLMPKIVQVDVYPAQHEGIVLQGGSVDNASSGRIKQSIERIHKAITGIQLIQHHDRHRQQLHSELNRNSHTGFVYGSMAETLVYILISVFQIYFVRRWFSTRRVAAPKAPKQWA